LQQVFGRCAPVVLEIGFGMGETTAAIAQERPDVDFLGIEVFTAGVGALLMRIEELGLTNIRIVHHDAVDVVRDMIAADSLAGVHIFFPDPWPKKRHHKRRLVAQPFIGMLAGRIAPGGYLHCATDWEDYARADARCTQRGAATRQHVGRLQRREGESPVPAADNQVQCARRPPGTRLLGPRLRRKSRRSSSGESVARSCAPRHR
jgi:tRNA (guanine-N(7)-)-methyltransferase